MRRLVARAMALKSTSSLMRTSFACTLSMASRPGEVGQLHGYAPVEAAGAQQRGVEALGAVGGREDDDAPRRVEAVHLGEQLVERLLALVVAAVGAGVALFAYRVYLVDEDDAGRLLIAPA